MNDSVPSGRDALPPDILRNLVAKLRRDARGFRDMASNAGATSGSIVAGWFFQAALHDSEADEIERLRAILKGQPFRVWVRDLDNKLRRDGTATVFADVVGAKWVGNGMSEATLYLHEKPQAPTSRGEANPTSSKDPRP